MEDTVRYWGWFILVLLWGMVNIVSHKSLNSAFKVSGEYGAQPKRCQTAGGGNDATFAIQNVQQIVSFQFSVLEENYKVFMQCVMFMQCSAVLNTSSSYCAQYSRYTIVQ